MTNDNRTTAPVYRYITTNLLTDEVLAEIPFQGVSYGRTLKSSGSFDGSIPVLRQTRSMNLFESTTPGRTALYVLRDGVCVWGGIIWSARYNESHTLTVSASEFPSYLNRRKIWRNLDFSGTGTLVVTDGEGELLLNDISSTGGFQRGAEVHVAFPAVPGRERDQGFSGYYTVFEAGNTTTYRATLSARFRHDVMDIVHQNGKIDFHTREPHFWQPGMQVSLNSTLDYSDLGVIEGSWTVEAVDALDKTRVVLTGPTGSSTRQPWNEGDVFVDAVVPSGTYENVTVTTHVNTHHFVRHLIELAMNDFERPDPNWNDETGYGIQTFVDVERVEQGSGWARLFTSTPHNLIVGQRVQVHNLHPALNRAGPVSKIVSDTVFEVTGPWTSSAPTNFQDRTLRFTKVRADASRDVTLGGVTRRVLGRVHATTATPHGLIMGNTVEVSASGNGAGLPAGAFSGRFTVSTVPTPYEFSYLAEVPQTLPETTLTPPVISLNGKSYPVTGIRNDTATTTVEYTGNDTILGGAPAVVSGFGLSSAIRDITYDKTLDRVWLETSEPHRLQTGDVVNVSGIQHAHQVWNVSAVSQSPHKANVSFVDSVNFRPGDHVTFQGVEDAVRIVSREGIAGNRVRLVVDRHPWFATGRTVRIDNLNDTVSVTATATTPGQIVFTTGGPAHSIAVGAKLDVTMPYSRTVTSFRIDRYRAIFTTGSSHNFVKGSKAKIDASSMGGLVGTYTIKNVSDTEIEVSIDEIKDKKLKEAENRAEERITGTVLISDTHPGAQDSVVVAVTNNTITVESTHARNAETLTNIQKSKISGPSILNGTHVVESIAQRGIITLATDYPPGTHSKYNYPKPDDKYSPEDVYDFSNKTFGRMHAASNLNGNVLVLSRPNSYTVQVSLPSGSLSMENGYNSRRLATGQGSLASRFNGSRTINVHSPTEIWWTSNAYPYSISERPPGGSAFVTLPVGEFVTGGVITADTSTTGTRIARYSVARSVPIPHFAPGGLVQAKVRPGILLSTYGPYPKSADIGFEFADYEMSPRHKMPPTYEGWEGVTVGKALTDYVSDLTGFDFRVDVSYDEETNQFRKTFVFVSNEFPDPPAPGELSPLSRFGADKVVFEHPGNISKYTLEQKATDASTRTFMVGRNPWGTDVPPPVSVATATDMLQDGWPLLDVDAKNASTYDEAVLYGYAQKDISETRPPQADIKITVNGSLQPQVGTYSPGDWCSIIIHDDEYVQQWMLSDQEPRDTVVLRKIDGYKVNVPNGVAFPETVELDLIPEWEVDRLGD